MKQKREFEGGFAGFEQKVPVKEEVSFYLVASPRVFKNTQFSFSCMLTIVGSIITVVFLLDTNLDPVGWTLEINGMQNFKEDWLLIPLN